MLLLCHPVCYFTLLLDICDGKDVNDGNTNLIVNLSLSRENLPQLSLGVSFIPIFELAVSVFHLRMLFLVTEKQICALVKQIKLKIRRYLFRTQVVDC